MNRKTPIFPCLNCGRDTHCVNRLVCEACRKKNGQGGKMSPETAHTILGLGFSQVHKERMHHLANKAKTKKLAEQEEAELDNYFRVRQLLSILKSKARKALKKNNNS